ncbi:MAG TPA: hypothetical protein VL096_06135 [Pirellulaceae bacterium]|nr:hypothetical protein [Pirellulaceae bacterium]
MSMAKLGCYLAVGLLLLATCGELVAAKRNNRNKAAAAAKAKQRAITNAINQAKSELAAREKVANVTGSRANGLQSEANASGFRFEQAKSEMTSLQHDAAGATSEVKELQFRIEQEQAADSPFRKTQAAYAKAVEELAEARDHIHGSLDFQAAYAIAEKASDRAAALSQLEQTSLANDEKYQTVKRRVEIAKQEFEVARLAIYRANPQWEGLVESARDAQAAAAKAEKSFNASAMEKGLESLNARNASRQAAAAQAAASAAKANLAKLEAMKNKGKPKPATSTSNAKKK